MPEARVPQLEELTLDEKIGQLFAVAAQGVFMNESSPAYEELVRHVRENHVGGVIWFVSNVYETAWLTQRLQSIARVPLLVSADIEAGLGMRFNDTTWWPSAMAVAATGDPSFAERAARVAAIESKALGINHLLAPVADVNVNPDNPVIGVRSFGDDPHEVARYVAAAVRGIQAEGLLATAKHFPGHGDTHVNSHRSLPVLDVTRERLETIELVPFRAAIEAGVASIMLGHLSVPALDPAPVPLRGGDDVARENPYAHASADELEDGGTLPATLSAPMIDGLLRRDLGFEGLVVSDAFDMGGLVNHFDPGEAAVRAIEAGTDQILKSPDTDAAIRAVREAVRDGRISVARIDESVRRILDAKRRVSFRVASQDEIFRIVDCREHRALAEEIAERGVRVVRDDGNLPLRRDARVTLLSISDAADVVDPLARFRAELAELLDRAPRTDVTSDTEVVILALAVRGSWMARSIRMPDAARRVIDSIPPHVPTIAISFGSPYIERDLPHVSTYLCSYGIQPIMQVAAARALIRA